MVLGTVSLSLWKCFSLPYFLFSFRISFISSLTLKPHHEGNSNKNSSSGGGILLLTWTRSTNTLLERTAATNTRVASSDKYAINVVSFSLFQDLVLVPTRVFLTEVTVAIRSGHYCMVALKAFTISY
jgi:hypothetical protein